MVVDIVFQMEATAGCNHAQLAMTESGVGGAVFFRIDPLAAPPRAKYSCNSAQLGTAESGWDKV